jgi:hypothetical protein
MIYSDTGVHVPVTISRHPACSGHGCRRDVLRLTAYLFQYSLLASHELQEASVGPRS